MLIWFLLKMQYFKSNQMKCFFRLRSNFCSNISQNSNGRIPFFLSHIVNKLQHMDTHFIELLSMDSSELAEKTAIRLTKQRFSCPFCNSVKYTQLRYLKTHIKECGLTFFCHIYKLNFKQKRTHKQHMRLKHPSYVDHKLIANSSAVFIQRIITFNVEIV